MNTKSDASHTRYEFIRIEAVQARKGDEILGEALRREGFFNHIEKPAAPMILHGSEHDFINGLNAYMAHPAKYLDRFGRERNRKRRSDGRAIIHIVASHPSELPQNEHERLVAVDAGKEWLLSTKAFLEHEFSSNLQLVVAHADESHLHIHGLAVGDPCHLHPGLKAEMYKGRRLDDDKLRRRAHIKGLEDFHARYHREVGVAHNLTRGYGKRRGPRVATRAIYRALTAGLDLAIRVGDLETLKSIEKALGINSSRDFPTPCRGQSDWEDNDKPSYPRPNQG